MLGIQALGWRVLLMPRMIVLPWRSQMGGLAASRLQSGGKAILAAGRQERCSDHAVLPCS